MTPKPLSDGPPRVIPVRFSDSEYAIVKAAAEDAALPISTFIRRYAVNFAAQQVFSGNIMPPDGERDPQPARLSD
jgi:hypothetical protein